MAKCDEVRFGDRNSLCGLIEYIYEFADTVYQQRVWIERKGPEWSWYSEALSQVFDSFRIREFANGKATEYGFSEEMLEGLARFADALDAFHATLPPGISDAQLVRLPGWGEVVRTAGAVMDAGVLDWLSQNCNDLPMFPIRWRGRVVGGTGESHQ